jgi:hypothetical protein
MMKYQLVIQWPAFSTEDYESMVKLEELLIDTLSDGDELDGHDAGSNEMNIFIRTDTPEDVFEEIQNVLSLQGMLADARAAYREVGKSSYKVLWPHGLTKFTVT